MSDPEGFGDDRTEVERLRQWVADLQSGMYVSCVYCGHRYGPGETTPVSMADALKAHIAQCPEHPMAGLLKALRSLTNEVSGQYTLAELAIRQELGNTNYQCVVDKLVDARAAIIKAGGAT